MTETFDDLYRDSWILLSYVRVRLKELQKARDLTPGDPRHLNTLRFIHAEIYTVAKERLGVTKEETIDDDYGKCMTDTNALLLTLVFAIEQYNDANRRHATGTIHAAMQSLRDRIYQMVETVDAKITTGPQDIPEDASKQDERN